MKKILLLVLFIGVLSLESVHAQVAVSQMGFHPNAQKQVVVYGNADTFQVVTPGGQVVYSGTLSTPVDSGNNPATCQGAQQCKVGDFSSFTQTGTYAVKTSLGQSPQFRIDNSIFSSSESLFMEFFNAEMQQGSAYHVDIHKAQNPPFTMQADGSFIMEAYMATLPLIRMGSAYRRNPGVFSSKYFSGMSDIQGYMRKYVDYIEELQDASGSKAVVRGWNNNFQCDFITPTTAKWNDVPETCMTWKTDTSSYFTTSAFLAYMEAYPSLDSAKKQEVLQRAVATYNFIRQNYNVAGDDAGFFGAATFLLYDDTGNSAYLTDAYSQRSKVPTSFSPDQVHGNEFYWEEYVRHKAAITGAGLAYQVNGQDPENFFAQKAANDWSAISKTGERVFQFDNSIQFQNSRFMLNEAILGAKAADLAGSQTGKNIAQAQLSWLTGMNRVQSGTGTSPMISRSFIFGIGDNPRYFHSRLVNPTFLDSGGTFTNGMRYIPGWIGGAFDANNDGVFNFNDDFWDWRFTETTNEIVADGVELGAYMDAIYKGSAAPAPVTQPPTNTTTATNTTTNTTTQTNTTTPPASGGTAFSNLQGIPATCSGGTISSDVYDGGRHILCASGSGSLRIDAWDKPSSTSPQYFEMYKISQAGSLLRICLLSTCISDNGYAKSPSYPLSSGTAGGSTSGGTGGGTTTSGTSASVQVAPWFPQGRSYVFICSAQGFSPAAYDWTFGDGQSQRTTANNVYHTYAGAGSYTLGCRASATGASATGTLAVKVA